MCTTAIFHPFFCLLPHPIQYFPYLEWYGNRKCLYVKTSWNGNDGSDNSNSNSVLSSPYHVWGALHILFNEILTKTMQEWCLIMTYNTSRSYLSDLTLWSLTYTHSSTIAPWTFQASIIWPQDFCSIPHVRNALSCQFSTWLALLAFRVQLSITSLDHSPLLTLINHSLPHHC